MHYVDYIRKEIDYHCLTIGRLGQLPSLSLTYTFR